MMKKIYASLGVMLTTTVLSVGAETLKTVPADSARSLTSSKGATFTMGGKANAEYVGVSQKRKDPNTEKGSLMFKGQLDFEMKHSVKDWLYGAVATLNLDRSASHYDIIKVAYLFASSEKLGNFQIGNLEGLERQMMSTGKNVMGGADAYAGRMNRVTNATSGILLEMPASYTLYATKFVYTTPNINGWQAGISYVPNSNHLGTKKLNTDFSTLFKAPTAKQQITAALSYGFGYGQMAMNLYANGTIGKVLPAYNTAASLYPIKTFQFGMLMDYVGWRLGAGYYNNQRSFIKKGSAKNAGQGYDVGIGREMGPVYVSLGYFGSSRKVVGGNATNNVGSIALDYKFAPGVLGYIEADFFRMRAPKAQYTQTYDDNDVYDKQSGVGPVNGARNGDNQGTVIVVGTQMRF